ncbi:hypothetical protein PRIPAC_85923 [Pristionchus pacificus]|uniref:Zinc finger protein n=1 Tax=Pristionchus pacificus TaxID=54126 RepID=A0A2A6BUL2_PRIPA|nr:hypothetical protein PRIPAC_85923 [Pristionchus pacificus]|eukprot:PDM69506.1 zinc finger protein [Pristionchus pacificus]
MGKPKTLAESVARELAKAKGDRLRDEFDVHCPICYDSFYKSPRVLACGHSICSGCMGKIYNSNCPMCQSISIGSDKYNLIFEDILNPPVHPLQFEINILEKEGAELAKQRDRQKKIFETAERKLNRIQSPKMRFIARSFNRVNYDLKNPVSTICGALYTMGTVILALACCWFLCMFVIVSNIREK